ncbi:tetratricopeptide repeat protein, partial [bacterium]|nr:tetratricopeptide repeat protein [bacterium]
KKKKKKQAASYFAQAKKAFERNDWQQAYDLDSAGLRIIPNNRLATARRAEAQSRLQAQSYLAMGKVDFVDGNYQDAMAKFRKAAELDSTNSEVRTYIARTELKIDELVKVYLDEGINLYTRDKYQEAIAKWKEALRLDPQHEGTLEYLAQAQERIKALRAIKK